MKTRKNEKECGRLKVKRFRINEDNVLRVMKAHIASRPKFGPLCLRIALLSVTSGGVAPEKPICFQRFVSLLLNLSGFFSCTYVQ